MEALLSSDEGTPGARGLPTVSPRPSSQGPGGVSQTGLGCPERHSMARDGRDKMMTQSQHILATVTSCVTASVKQDWEQG